MPVLVITYLNTPIKKYYHILNVTNPNDSNIRNINDF